MRKRRMLVAGVVALALVGAACGESDDTGSGGGGGGEDQALTGSVFISGSSTVEPISSLVAELFAEENPGVEITVEGPRTGDGFELFCNGETDISDESRAIEQEEIDACAENGIEYTELEVALDGIAGSYTSFGWVGFSFYEQNQDVVKAFEIDGGEGCVAPSFDTISDASYPLSRSLFIYVNNAKAAESEALTAFVDFYLSDTGLRTAVEEVAYVVLPDDRIENTLSTWEGAKPA